MLNPVSASDLISAQSKEFKGASESTGDDDGLSTSIDNDSSRSDGARFEALDRISNKTNEVGLQQRETVSKLNSIDTQLESTNKEIKQVEDLITAQNIRKEQGTVEEMEKQSVVEGFSSENFNLGREISEKLSIFSEGNSIYKNGENVDLQLKKDLNIEDPSFLSDNQGIQKGYEDTHLNSILQVRDQLNVERTNLAEQISAPKDGEVDKWDSIKADEMASELKVQINNDSAKALQTHSTINSQEVMALLR